MVFIYKAAVLTAKTNYLCDSLRDKLKLDIGELKCNVKHANVSRGATNSHVGKIERWRRWKKESEVGFFSFSVPYQKYMYVFYCKYWVVS